MRKLLSLIAFTLLACAAWGQASSSAGFGLDPSDQEAVEQFRVRMDSIRRHRPTVALVLSGGGAKGAAHIGVLKFMEQYDIPIDLVVGTSIGGLVGGLYSLGYSPTKLDSIIRSVNWKVTLSDDVPREYLPLRRIRYKDRFAFSFPFHYGKESPDIIRFSAGSGDPSVMVSNSLMGGMPSGLIFGQNVNYIFSSLTPGYADSTSFLDFPIPFACVATDMVSGHAKIWHSGDICKALRSTMSIPGLFTPVRTADMILTDGGMRNNFPVDIARQLGADIVIGVDLSQERMNYDDITNLADIVWRSIDMLASDSFERNIEAVDMYVKPRLTEFDMMSFDKDAVSVMIDRGFDAAKHKQWDFAALKGRIGAEEHFELQAPPARDVNRNYLLIDTVIITGVGRKEANLIRSKLFIKSRSVVNRYELEKAVSAIYGDGGYDYVNYQLLGSGEPYHLQINCKKGPKHQFGVGFRMDTEELVAILLNLGFNTNSMQGASLDMTAKIGSNPYFTTRFTYDVPKVPTFNLEGTVRWTDRNSFIMGDNRYNISYLFTDQRFYLSNIRWHNIDIQGGIANDYFNIRRLLTDNLIGDYDESLRAWDYPSVFIHTRKDTRNDSYFPTSGFTGGLSADIYGRFGDETDESLPSTSIGEKKMFATFAGDASMAVPVFNFLTLMTFADFRFIVGDDIPVPYANALGGYMRGRYVSHQIPFAGIDNAAFRRNYLVAVGADARLNIARNHYVTGRWNWAYDFYNFSQFEHGEMVNGMAVGYTYNSVVGPLSLWGHWSSLTDRYGIYLSVGLDF